MTLQDRIKLYVDGALMARHNAQVRRKMAKAYFADPEGDMHEASKSFQRGLGYLKTARVLKTMLSERENAA